MSIIKNLSFESFQKELRDELEKIKFQGENLGPIAEGFNNGLRCMEITAETVLLKTLNRQNGVIE